MRQISTLVFSIISLIAAGQNGDYRIINKGNGRITVIHNGKSTNFIQEEVNRNKEVADSIRIEDYSVQIDHMEKEVEEIKLKYFMIGLYKGVEFQYKWSIQGNIGKVVDIHKSDVNPEARKIIVEEGNKCFNVIFPK